MIFQHFSVKELSIIQSIKMLDSRKKEADVLEALDYYHLIRRYGKTQIGAVLAHRVKQIRNFENLEKRLLRLSAIQEKQHM